MRFLFTLLAAMSLSMASKPEPWQMTFQKPASQTMENIASMHDFLLVIIFSISIFISLLLFYILWRFRASKNPVPSKTSHNTMLEVIWTLIPVAIVTIIAIPSMKILYYKETIPKPDITVKVIGHQWYWTYEYPKHDISYDSYIIEDKDLKPGQLRLLEVDNRLVVPKGKVVQLLITADDVLHSWAVPALGVKKDAIPGKINETWFKTDQEGMVYYGQCSEICGAKHGFMPIAVEVVSQEKYDRWIKEQKDA